jgi:hypothetical protein
MPPGSYVKNKSIILCYNLLYRHVMAVLAFKMFLLRKFKTSNP